MLLTDPQEELDAVVEERRVALDVAPAGPVAGEGVGGPSEWGKSLHAM
jgi:hypothetical protein